MKYLALSLCVLFCAVLIKDKHKAFALALSVSGACIILLSVVIQLSRIVNSINSLASLAPSSQGYVSLMLKALAITLLTQEELPQDMFM